MEEKNEIIVYQPEDGEFHIEVHLENETVWLTQAQMAELFNATKQNVSLHISNIFEEGELLQNSTVKESLTVRKEGKREVTRKILLYNLDVIIRSVIASNPSKALDSDSGLSKSSKNTFLRVAL